MKKVVFLLSLILIITFQSCKKEDSPTEPEDEITTDGNIKTGTTINVTTQTIGTTGGTISVNKPGDPLNGFELTVQQNSFTTPQNLKVSYAPITSHKFDPDFKTAAPLIKISSATDFASKNITFKVPLKLSDGEIAMAFLYDEATGSLEGLPIEDLTQNYIQFSTRRLSSGASILKKTTKTAEENSNIIVLSILESKLEGKTVLATGFEPGVSDWEFVNRGSYIAPGGHCAGQAITAMWFYTEKTSKGLGNLFHKYDKICNKDNPGFVWEDNGKGYRFASVVQTDLNFGIDKIQEKYEFQEKDPRFTWWSFIMAIVLTKEPQYLVLYNKGRATAHAVIVYKIGLAERKLYIADPNFPANRDPVTGVLNVRSATYNSTAKKIEPYVTKVRVGLPDESYNNFAFFGKYIFIDKSKIESRWTEFESGTIGNDKFPSYSIINTTDNSVITDGYNWSTNKITFACSAVCDYQIHGTTNYQPYEVIDSTGTFLIQKIEPIGYNGKASLTLAPGKNKFGFIIYGSKKYKVNNVDYSDEHYIDFKWITINYTGTATTLTIKPSELEATLNATYDFTAVYNGTLPSRYKCYWSFLGEIYPKTKENDMVMKYQFKKEGYYQVTVDVFDITNPNSSVKLGSAMSQVEVKKGPLSDLYGLGGLYLKLYGECEFNNSDIKVFDFSIGDFSMYTKLNWSGNKFSASYSFPRLGVVAGDTTRVTGTINGTVTDDGSTITSLSITENAKNNKTPYSHEFTISLSNFSIKKYDSGSYYRISGFEKGAQVQGIVSGLSLKSKRFDSQSQTWNEVSLKTFKYNSTLLPASLSIEFQ